MKLTATIIVAGLLAMSLPIIKVAAEHGSRPLPKQAKARESYGPDISHCFSEEEERDLWDCIRHEED